ncbi:universal stress protein [Chloroflexota bacterium]
MYKKMLVTLDGSELAEVVLDYAKEFAGGLGLDTVLLHICAPKEHEFITMRRGYVNRVAEALQREAREIQKKGTNKPKHEALEVQGEVVEGHVAEEIVRYADKQQSDLILMSTHGRSGIKRWAIGSIADKVIRATRRPVLLVRAKSSYEISNNVVIPLDGSRESEVVVGLVEELAVGLSSKIELLLVLEQFYNVYTSGGRSAKVRYSDKRMEQLKDGAIRYLERIASQLKDKGINTRSEVRIGSPPVEIIKFASETQARMVAMLKRGRSGISPLDIGSVADKILRRGLTPILLFNAPGRTYRKE